MSEFNKYRKQFSKERIAQKINRTFGKLGQKVVYSVLLLYNAYGHRDTPSWAKNIIIGALGYFLSPLDAIPDLSPFLGYTDDIGIMSFALVTIACYINEEVRNKAKVQLKNFFGEIDDDVVAEVNKTL